MKNILATTLAALLLTAAVGPSYAVTEAIQPKILGILVSASIVEDKVQWTLVTDPVELTLDECVEQADQINNTKDIPYTMMCMPAIRPVLAPAI